MNQFRKILLAVIFTCSVVAFGSFAFASDIYFANTAAGSNNGTSCANAYAWNDPSNGWNKSAQQQPDNVLHVCGTITFAANGNALSTVNSGTSGHPITFMFEPGAILQAPYFNAGGHDSGAVVITKSYWTIDGGSTGIIQNTLNGDSGAACLGGACSNQQGTSQMVVDSDAGGDHAIIQNLTIRKVFVKKVNTDDGALDSTIAVILAGSNSRATNNVLSDGYMMMSIGRSGSSNLEIDHNTVSACAHCFTTGLAGTGSSVNGLLIHDNDFAGNNALYDTPSDEYHVNAYIVFLDSSSCTNCSINGLQIYNNFCHGLWSNVGQLNSCIFMDEQGSNRINGYAIYNNIDAIDDSTSGPSGAELISESQNQENDNSYILNNTVYQAHNDGTCMHLNNTVSLTLENNIITGCGYPYENVGNLETTPTVDYNTWYNTAGGGGSGWIWPTNPNCSTGTGCSFSNGAHNWQGNAFDTHGQYGNDPKLDTNTFTLGSGSSAIGQATNLTNLCSKFAALCTGAPQTFGAGGSCGNGCVARPASGAWDAGAYPSSSSNPPPNPPSGLTATVK